MCRAKKLVGYCTFVFYLDKGHGTRFNLQLSRVSDCLLCPFSCPKQFASRRRNTISKIYITKEYSIMMCAIRSPTVCSQPPDVSTGGILYSEALK